MEVRNASFYKSLWSALAEPAPPAEILKTSARADVVVVGAGILGLSTTLHLAAEGVNTILLEANEPGFGASGRNTGFVVPSYTAGLGPRDIDALLGSGGEKLNRMIGGSGKTVFEVIRRFSIECSAEQTGWLQPAHTAEKMRMLERRAVEWQALDQPVEMLGKAEIDRLTGTNVYLGGLIDRSGGQINPLAYTRGLAKAAMRLGATIYSNSPVLEYLKIANEWRVRTTHGEVTARNVIFTVNALGKGLLPNIERSLITVPPYQVATQPLSPEIRARILPERNPVADVHNHTFAYRWSPDNRLVTGGIAVRNDAGAIERMSQYFLQRLRMYLPDLPPLQADYAWAGLVATTQHFIPQIWTVEPGVLAPIGCNGRGVAATTALGAALAKYLATGDAAFLPLAPSAARPRFFHGVLQKGPSAWLGWNRLRDWNDDRQAIARARDN